MGKKEDKVLISAGYTANGPGDLIHGPGEPVGEIIGSSTSASRELFETTGANIIYVNFTTGDDTTGTGTIGNPYKTYSKAVSVWTAGKTIEWMTTDDLDDAITKPVQTSLGIIANISTLNQWFQNSYGPGNRVEYASAFDSTNSVLYVHGGRKNGTRQSDFWKYDLSNGTWTELTPTGTAPTARYLHRMVWDSANSRIYLFGGNEGSPTSQELFYYDISGNSWNDPSDTSPPSARQSFGMVIDNATSIIYIHGGDTGVGGLSDTYSYTIGTNTWANLAPTGSPVTRSIFAMALDSDNSIIYVFGGHDGASSSISSTWAYSISGNSWSNKSPASNPTARHGISMVYSGGKFYLFGGNDDTNYLGDSWAYSVTANDWTDLSPSGDTPIIRYNYGQLFASSSEVYLHAGGELTRPNYGDIWKYSISGNTWTEIDAIPPVRQLFAMAETSGKIYVHGGSTGGSGNEVLSDFWSYAIAGDQWVKLSPSGTPPTARSGHGMIESGGDLYLFGGIDSNPTRLNDLFKYDISANSWTTLSPTGGPPSARNLYGDLVEKDGVIYLFGGNDGAKDGETWSYTVSTNTWANLAPGASPTARDSHAMTIDKTNGVIYMFGGNTGSLDGNTWSYDISLNTWTNLSAATPPGARQNHSIVIDSTFTTIYLYGGQDAGGDDFETWAYSISGNSWTEFDPNADPFIEPGSKMIINDNELILFGGGFNDLFMFSTVADDKSYIEDKVNGFDLYDTRAKAQIKNCTINGTSLNMISDQPLENSDGSSVTAISNNFGVIVINYVKFESASLNIAFGRNVTIDESYFKSSSDVLTIGNSTSDTMVIDIKYSLFATTDTGNKKSMIFYGYANSANDVIFNHCTFIGDIDFNNTSGTALEQFTNSIISGDLDNDK
jgi:hypothetical protein